MTSLHRRHLLCGMAVSGGATLVRLALGPTRALPRAAQGVAPAGDAAYPAEVDAGLVSFRLRAAEHTALAEALRAAIESGDLAAAKAAYVAVRPPYEEIEVLAASFPETDAAIDARPYAIDGGETSPDYVSVHRIEALLYRDGDLGAALPFAGGLVESARHLEQDLERRDAFNPTIHFEGMIALANEIPSKKISSEEETWSDQSLLIFHHNWLGIRSQYEPFAAAVEAADPGAAAEVEAGHEAALASIASYPPAAGGAFPPYSAVPMTDRGKIVLASYVYRDALLGAARTLGLAQDRSSARTPADGIGRSLFLSAALRRPRGRANPGSAPRSGGQAARGAGTVSVAHRRDEAAPQSPRGTAYGTPLRRHRRFARRLDRPPAPLLRCHRAQRPRSPPQPLPEGRDRRLPRPRSDRRCLRRPRRQRH